MKKADTKIALVGNPNIGKTTLFNTLCGLKQKTGNYPGVTVAQVKGNFDFGGESFEVIDLPGVNSIYPQSADEEVVFDYLASSDDLPDKLVVVVSALNLKRNLYLFHQVQGFGIPIVLAVNMIDAAEKRGIAINCERLEQVLKCPVVPVSAKTGEGIIDLKSKLVNDIASPQSDITDYLIDIDDSEFENYVTEQNIDNPYIGFLDLIKHKKDEEVSRLSGKKMKAHKLRVNESILRYKTINSYFDEVFKEDKANASDLTSKLDKWLLHPVWGYVIFLAIMFLVFQSIFNLAAFPMDWIDAGTTFVAEGVKGLLPEGYLSDLISDGLIPGIGGVLIFIPQIAILFFFFSILEETGYMTRIVFLMDRILQRFGMSGKSVVPLISGMACAIPSIMAARTIENTKERLITILVAPLMTCSARIPVYVILISLIVPESYTFKMEGGEFTMYGLQGMAMLGMYLLGIVSALISAWLFKHILKSEHKSYLILEMPRYLVPSLKNIGIRVWTNALSFVTNAGKIIIATSIILFVLATNGGDHFKRSEEIVKQEYSDLSGEEYDNMVANYQLEHSYLGNIGKAIEPAIKPLGYDWKVGIALISSLAAREVFIGTMSIIYNINSEEPVTIKEKMEREINANTGVATFNLATSISLLLFYAFALQCFSTVAVTYKETKSVKWTTIQFVYMAIFAYIASLIAYQLLS